MPKLGVNDLPRFPENRVPKPPENQGRGFRRIECRSKGHLGAEVSGELGAEDRAILQKRWKQDSGYHRRSIAETTMFRLKIIFGGNLSARKFDNQAVELLIKCAALNRMSQIAKPDSYEVAA